MVYPKLKMLYYHICIAGLKRVTLCKDPVKGIGCTIKSAAGHIFVNSIIADGPIAFTGVLRPGEGMQPRVLCYMVCLHNNETKIGLYKRLVTLQMYTIHVHICTRCMPDACTITVELCLTRSVLYPAVSWHIMPGRKLGG